MRRSINIFLILLALTFVLAQPALASEVPQNTLETSATSVFNVDPDLVQLSLTLRTEEQSASAAQQRNAAAVNKAIDLLLKEGLTNDEIKTTAYSTYSYTKTTDNKNLQNEVTVSTSGLEATFKELDKAGEILTKLADISEVNVNSVNYSVQDPQKYKQQVITSAITEAKQNLLYSAEALGVQLDKLVNLRIDFSSNSGSNRLPMNSGALSGSALPQPQSPDKITLTATADLSYSVQQ